jgi:hypothetical protein
MEKIVGLIKFKNNKILLNKIIHPFSILKPNNNPINPNPHPSERQPSYLLGETREVLVKGKVQYSCPPCTNLFRSAPFYIENIISLFYKTSYLNEEVKCTEPSSLVSIPW